MVATVIPIENIYFLLCYAWDRLEQHDVADVVATDQMELADLFARILRRGVTQLLKRGLDRSYEEFTEEIPGIRGKLDVSRSAKRSSFLRAHAVCTFDELSVNSLHNQLVRSTLRELAQVEHLDRTLAEALRELHSRMRGVQDIPLRTQDFSRAVLSRNNRHYQFLLDVCELVANNLLPTERAGRMKFRDFVRDDDQMAKLFESFLRRFYSREQDNYRVSAPHLNWHAKGESAHRALLPRMATDIVLTSDQRSIVIDAKYYARSLSEHFSKASIRSGHLYQLFTYMKHLNSNRPTGDIHGMLIYPRTTRSLYIKLVLDGHPVSVATVDLSEPWQRIHTHLLSLIPIDSASEAITRFEAAHA